MKERERNAPIDHDDVGIHRNLWTKRIWNEPYPVTDVYTYRDEDGDPVVCVGRVLKDDGAKEFVQWWPGARKFGLGRKANGEKRRRPTLLYHLPEVQQSDHDEPVYFVEGEKDVLRAESEGKVATCLIGGSNSTLTPELAEPLEGRRVVVITDCDTPGYRYAWRAYEALEMIADSVVLRAPKKGSNDLSDHLDNRHGWRDFRKVNPEKLRRRARTREDTRREEEGGARAARAGGSTADIAAALLRDHIARFAFEERDGESRDRAIFDYAQQMYWNRVPKDMARRWARFLRNELPDTDAKGEPQPFTDADVDEKLDSAYSGDQKEPSYLPLGKLGRQALDSERARRMARRRVDEEERELRDDNAKLQIYGPADAAALNINYEWIIRRVLETKGHGPIAGPKKAAKSWIALIMAVCVATGMKFLGHFPVEKIGPVLYLTGEGGLENTELRLRHICRSFGLAREDVPVYVTATILTMGTDNWHRELSSAMEHIGPLVVFVDPIYPYHDESQSGILYQRGKMIMRAALPMLDSGAAAMFVDHWRKTNRGDDDLDNISGAGMGEFAHTWISLDHLAPPDIREGSFTLRMNTGSRLWGGDQWRLDLDTGPWNDDDMNYSGKLTYNVTEHVPLTAGDKEDRDESVVLGLIQNYPLEFTTKQIIDAVSFGRDRVTAALERLGEEGLAAKVSHQRDEGDRKVTRELWMPVESDPEILVSKGQS